MYIVLYECIYTQHIVLYVCMRIALYIYNTLHMRIALYICIYTHVYTLIYVYTLRAVCT